MSDPIYYIDISKIGKDYTGKKDVLVLKNEQALLESVKNILLTEPGQRIMEPTFGTRLTRYLFEPIDAITEISMKNEIVNSIRNFESRVDNLEVTINTSEDENSIEIFVYFNMKTSTKTQQIVLELNKIR